MLKKILCAALMWPLLALAQSYPSPTYQNLTVLGTFTGNIGTGSLAAQAANTVLANPTGSSASPTAFAMPSCNAATNALTWASGAGFACNSSINAATLGGATFATPGPIGSTTPNAGSFTTLSGSGNDALLYGNTSGQTIANSTTTVVTGWTKVYDRVNANFNASTGTFTAPVSGYYLVSANLIYTGTTTTIGATYGTIIEVNGAVVAQGARQADSTSSVLRDSSVCVVINVTAGQTIQIAAYQSSGSSTPLASSATRNFVSITRLP